MLPPLPPIGSDPVIEAYKKDVDRTLLIETAKLTPDQRLRQMQALAQQVVAQQAVARRAAASRVGDR